MPVRLRSAGLLLAAAQAACWQRVPTVNVLHRHPYIASTFVACRDKLILRLDDTHSPALPLYLYRRPVPNSA